MIPIKDWSSFLLVVSAISVSMQFASVQLSSMYFSTKERNPHTPEMTFIFV